MKLPIALFITAALAMLVGCNTTEKNPADRLGPQSAVVRIESKSGEQSAVEGRGFLVTSDGVIATCSKLVAGGQTLHVVLYDGRMLPAQYMQQDKESGVALVQIKATGLPTLRIFDDDIVPGMHVRALGSAGVTHGRFDHWENFGRDIDFTSKVQPEDCGAPLLADDGRAMGIVLGPVEGQPGEFDAAPIWQVLRLMPELARWHPYTD